VTSDVVRIGDVIDNAGTAAQIAIYRAPDLGTTGSLPTAQVIAALQAHQVIGVDTKGHQGGLGDPAVALDRGKEIEAQVAHALEHRSGLGDAANLSLTFDRDLQDIQLEASYTGACSRSRPGTSRAAAASMSASRSATTAAPRRPSCASPARDRNRGSRGADPHNVERNDVLKSSDVITERRPKPKSAAMPRRAPAAVGMQMRKQLRAGQACGPPISPSRIWCSATTTSR
jgi:flagella basal body P-ring formation protein FlgA